MHTNPAIHNAMWPGLVGKGPDAEPPIDLDTMLDLTAAASVDGVKFDGVDLFLFDPHVNIDSRRRRPQEAGRQGRREEARRRLASSRRSGRRPAAARRWAARKSAANFLTQVQKACRIAEVAQGARRPAVRRRPHRLGGEPGRLGQGPGRQPEEDRRDVPRRRATSPKSTASGSPPKARSAGAACTAGSATSSCSSS